MSSRYLYIKKTAGIFPGANSVDELWENLISGKVAPLTKLDKYWNVSSEEYKKDDQDGFISTDLGHLSPYSFEPRKFPRQISAGIEIGNKLLDGIDGERNLGLVLATEWTDPSYYDAQLGFIPSHDAFSVERQIETIKTELGISGPALAVDTACASSLYALELAKGLLSSYDLKGVLVIGLNLYLHSFLYRGFTKLGALSKKGALTSFDADADGIIPGEAVCGILVDQDSTGALAEINAIGLSSDGNEGSAFSPGLMGQLAAYERAYRIADIRPDEIDFLEAHGTATVLGDQTELTSIERYFNRPKGRELPIGSSKSNVGHTLAASGLVSLIKSVGIIQHRTIPPHIPITPHPYLKDKGVRILESPYVLEKKNIAVGVSSFGFGGSNAHIVLCSPQPREQVREELKNSFYVRNFEQKNETELKATAPILSGIPMGPKMQERYDKLQRQALNGVQKLISGILPEKRIKYSCVFLNNLGGTLSVDFERKYRLKTSGPALSIEGIASTLPSMMSGAPAMIFNFQGHHMLISGGKGSLVHILKLIPYLLQKSEGDIILGVASDKVMGLLHLTPESTHSVARIEFSGRSDKSEKQDKDLGEATGIDRLLELLKSEGKKEFKMDTSAFTVTVERKQTATSEMIVEKLLLQSHQNKEVALNYLDLVMSLKPERIRNNQVGQFLKNCEKTKGKAAGELIVDESHSYFFDHPLDHIPGILTIHGCEELLNWFLEEKHLITSINIRFVKFLEKDETITINLLQTGKDDFEISVNQGRKRAGTLRVTVSKRLTSPLSGKVSIPLYEEEKKYTHKHRNENVLVSQLLEGQTSYALPLTDSKNLFFQDLLKQRSSVLYLAEVTRQFVMLLAHLSREIPLSTKMNLISTEIEVSEWLVPPFELHLGSFILNETEDFLMAEVEAEFKHEGRAVGRGKIKAQVVSKEYYELQRREG